jgi:hypothetical protein
MKYTHQINWLITVCIFGICIPADLYGQKDTIQTEVFTLSSCEPTALSFIGSKKGIKKLETQSNKLSAIRIIEINPLRYKYYINNEAITQFVDPSITPFSINPFINGQYLNVAPEIKIPEIFKTDSVSGKIRSTVRTSQNNIKIWRDSMEILQTQANDRYWEVYDSVFTKKTPTADSSGVTKIAQEKAQTDPKYKELNKGAQKSRRIYESELSDYQIFTSNLPINNPAFGILESYRKIGIDSTDSTNKELWVIKKMEKDFGDRYKYHINKFKSIDSLLEITLNYRQPALEDTLRNWLRDYGFIWPSNSNSSGYSGYYSGYSTYRSYDYNTLKASISEQILNKKFQLYEEFVLNVATTVGVYVQNIFSEYSRFNNELLSLNCVNDSTLERVKVMRQRLVNTFEFIQRTSAELQVMVSYLDINTELYESIARKVNNNYLFLLQYLKNLDYVCKANSIQFTLATHTNLKNIDLVRYTVKREDNVTNGSQTYNYDLWVRGGVKVDFSVGFFGTALTDNMYNKVLLDSVGGIDSIRITRQDRGDFSFAFGGMVNITPRNGAGWLNIGGSIGIAYSNTNQLQVLAGISLHFGKTERLILHGGFGFGNVKYLDVSANDFKFFDRSDLNKKVTRETLQDVSEKDRVYILHSPDVKFSSYTIPTVDKFVARPFFGISYNLSKKNALQAVSGNGVTTFGNNLQTGVPY